MANKETFIGEAPIESTPRTPFKFKLKAGSVGAENLKDKSVTANKIADNAVGNRQLAANSVESSNIVGGAVTTDQLADNSITTAKIQNNAVTENKIDDEAVTTQKIASNAVTGSKIDKNAVTEDKIADNAITNNKIVDGTITGDKFRDDSIDGSKIKNNSVSGSKLADGAIGAVDIQDNTLSGSKLVDNSVDGAKLVGGAVTTAKLKDNSIDGSKIADGTIQGLDIKDGTIPGTKLKDNSISGQKLKDGIIDNTKLADNSIPGSKLLDESINGEKIQPNTIHGSKLENNTVDGADIIDGTLDGSKLKDNSIEDSKIVANAIETRHIKSNTISGTKIANDAIDSTKIRNNSLVGDNFANGAVTEGKLQNDTIATRHIADNAVTTGKIADNAVTTDKIPNGAVTVDKLAPQAVQQITDLETQFQGNETTRQTNETTRISNETGRVNAESGRVEAETSRVSAETSRDSAETTRQSNETTRQSNETTRENNETTRVTNEEQRQTNETNRTATASTDHNTAVEDHNQAATDHNTAVSDHSIAEEDHIQAVTDHNTAATDHTTATTDHSTAADDHATAASDRTTATTDHTRAESDHTNITNAIASADLVFDISLAHASEGVLAQYADLATALGTDGANVPSENRHGGMTVKFVQSSDNKYVHYNLLADSFTTDVTKWAIDDGGVYIENPEFINVKTDSEGKILWAIKADGSIYWGAGVPQQVIDYVTSKISELSLDEYEDIVTFLGNLIEGDSLATLLNAKADAAETTAALALKANTFDVNNALDGKVDKITGKSLIDEEYATGIGYIDDPEERIEIKTDSEEKVISYRDKDGVLHENVGIEAKSLTLDEDGMTDFQKALKSSGFQGGGMDFSDKDIIELPEPKKYSILNLILDRLPSKEEETSSGCAEYYDFSGNYFKMECSIEIQGQTSTLFAYAGGKGNYTLDIPKDIKFGNWVPQDSFHLKGCAKDVTRGTLATSYKWAYMMQEYLNAKPNKVLMNEENITTSNATGDRMTDWPSDARCLPDGFPCEVYVNGKYHGLYSWQLKKHRKNYSMDKKDYTSFFLDAGYMMSDWPYDKGIWNEGPKRWWNGFEIKNPKDLILSDGSSYADRGYGELISARNSILDTDNWAYTEDFSTTEPISGMWDSSTQYAVDDTCWCYDEDIEWWRKFKAIQANQNKCPLAFEDNTVYDNSNKNHKNSAQTKSIIISFSKKYLEVDKLINDGNTNEAKAKFNEYFDYNACMLVFIFNCLNRNGDSIKKNTLWGVYGGGKIFPMLWDLDFMYGVGWTGVSVSSPSTGVEGEYRSAKWPLKLFYSLYADEIRTTYCNLRRDKIIDIDTWHSIMFDKWVLRIGEDAYNRDIKKWPDTPSYRADMTNTDYWQKITKEENAAMWDEETAYAINDVVNITNNGYIGLYSYKAIAASTGICPVKKFYTYPIDGGFFDSPKRMEKWLTEQISLFDNYWNYSE